MIAIMSSDDAAKSASRDEVEDDDPMQGPRAEEDEAEADVVDPGDSAPESRTRYLSGEHSRENGPCRPFRNLFSAGIRRGFAESGNPMILSNAKGPRN
jgi:hypothetical protein